jgi:hypothetical protein
MTKFTSMSAVLDELSPDVPATGLGWDDVLARADALAASRNGSVRVAHQGRRWARLHGGRPRRYVVVAVALVALVSLVVAAAYALGHPIVDFGRAPKGGRTVVNFFGRMTIGVPTGIPVRPHEARRITAVRIGGAEHVLWIAPIRGGGFCSEWSGLSGGCRSRSTRSGADSLAVDGLAEAHALALAEGSFFQRATARIVLAYADGEQTDVPFVWVTAPIEAGFFVFGIPDSHRRRGHQPVSIALLDSKNQTLENERIVAFEPRRRSSLRLVRHRLDAYPPMMIPAQAEWQRRQQLFATRSADGVPLGLWVAPKQGGGSCFWTNRASGCSSRTQPLHRPPAPPLWLSVERGPGYVTLCCAVAADITRVRAHFQDGDQIDLRTKDGYLLWPIPARHYRPGHRLDALVGYSAPGTEIAVRVVPTDVRALYPCSKPKNYGYGVVMCP